MAQHSFNLECPHCGKLVRADFGAVIGFNLYSSMSKDGMVWTLEGQPKVQSKWGGRLEVKWTQEEPRFTVKELKQIFKDTMGAHRMIYTEHFLEYLKERRKK